MPELSLSVVIPTYNGARLIRRKEAADAADWMARAKSRLTVLNRVWGSDPEFLASIGGEYHRLVRAVRLAKIRGLVALGRPRDARSEIRSLSHVPLPYRAAALRRALHNLRSGSAAPL
jgi:hypothetical protein